MGVCFSVLLVITVETVIWKVSRRVCACVPSRFVNKAALMRLLILIVLVCCDSY